MCVYVWARARVCACMHVCATVVKYYLALICYACLLQPEVRSSVSKFMAYVHACVNEASRAYLANEKRYNYTTPKSFLEQVCTLTCTIQCTVCASIHSVGLSLTPL